MTAKQPPGQGTASAPSGSLSRPRGRFFLSRTAQSDMDVPFFIGVILLLVLGMVMLYSVSYAVAYYREGDAGYYIKRQLAFAALGLAAMLIISRLDYHILHRFVWIGYGVTVILLIVALFMPARNDAHRWIFLPTPDNPIISFQPSEIAKLEVIVLFAHLACVHQERMKSFKYGVLPFVIPLALIVIFVVIEPHLSGTILILSIAAIMMFTGGTKFKWFALAVALGIVLLVGLLVLRPETVPVAQKRIEVWLNPESDPRGTGMQVLQGLMAIGSGGPLGLGLGNSRQKYMYVPEPYNDAIFTIVCEELGFVGAVIILLLFGFLLYRGLHIALHARDRFGSLLVVGVISQVTLQNVLNILVVTGTIPYTGITLPFFSYGGTALSLLLAEMGLVLSVSRQANIHR